MSRLDFRPINVPPAGNPFWIPTTIPLLALITEKARTINEIVEWGRQHGHSGYMTRQLLAWLSLNDLVRYDEPSRAWKITEPEQSS